MRIQTPFEEKLNSISHGIGALFGIAALVLLIIFDTQKNSLELTKCYYLWYFNYCFIYGFYLLPCSQKRKTKTLFQNYRPY